MVSIQQIFSITFGFLTVCNVVLPKSLMIMILFVITVAGVLAYIVYSGWEQSDPNQWLLIIENGKLKKAGVGLKAFRWPNQTCVRYKSEIRKISFNAEQVTKEMQGLNVSGFAIWGVYRLEDGPLKCYQYTQSSNADDNVKTLCESIVRNCIANTQMMDVIKNRFKLRDIMKQEIQKQVQGWGVWMETIEITEVRISSQNLFKDLQTEFRNSKKLIAEKCKHKTSQAISLEQVKYEALLSTQEQELETQRLDFLNDQDVQRDQAKTNYYTNKLAKEKQIIHDQKRKELKELENRQKLNRIVDEERQKIAKRLGDCELEILQSQNEVYNNMSAKNLIKYEMDKIKTTFNSKGCYMDNVSIKNFVGDENIAGMPLMAMLTQQAQTMMNN